MNRGDDGSAVRITSHRARKGASRGSCLRGEGSLDSGRQPGSEAVKPLRAWWPNGSSESLGGFVRRGDRQGAERLAPRTDCLVDEARQVLSTDPILPSTACCLEFVVLDVMGNTLTVTPIGFTGETIPYRAGTCHPLPTSMGMVFSTC